MWSPAPASRSCASPSMWPCKEQPSGPQTISSHAPQPPQRPTPARFQTGFPKERVPPGCSMHDLPSPPHPFFYLVISAAPRFRQILQGTEVLQAPSPAGVEDAGQRQGEDLSRGEVLSRGSCTAAADPARHQKPFFPPPGSGFKNFSVPTPAALWQLRLFRGGKTSRHQGAGARARLRAGAAGGGQADAREKWLNYNSESN